MSKPLAVCISDIHFNINNLELASASLRAALKKAEDLEVPLVIAGDLNDTKAIIRAEVANRLIEIFGGAEAPVFVMVGNHDLINEKGSEHGLNYLAKIPGVIIVDKCGDSDLLPGVAFFPYQNSSEELKRKLSYVPKGKILIMHQGFLGAQMGDYVQDKSSISVDLVKDFTVISGHYHKHQTIGTVTYIGSPYTITFTEANDPPKGFLILNEDGSFIREILNLRKHRILDCTLEQIDNMDIYGINAEHSVEDKDIIWLKVRGEQSKLSQLDKKELGQFLFGHSNYKLDLIPTDSDKVEAISDTLTDVEILDKLIDADGDTDEQKTYLKTLWRDL